MDKLSGTETGLSIATLRACPSNVSDHECGRARCGASCGKSCIAAKTLLGLGTRHVMEGVWVTQPVLQFVLKGRRGEHHGERTKETMEESKRKPSSRRSRMGIRTRDSERLARRRWRPGGNGGSHAEPRGLALFGSHVRPSSDFTPSSLVSR